MCLGANRRWVPPHKEHLIPENTCVPFLISLDIYLAFHHVRQDQYLHKVYQAKVILAFM